MEQYTVNNYSIPQKVIHRGGKAMKFEEKWSGR
jgi:hypothetical protein